MIVSHLAAVSLIAAVIGPVNGALAATAQRNPFGTLTDGTSVEAVDLSNASGVHVRIITLGAIIQSVVTPDRGGNLGDIVLGYATAQEYLNKPRFFGATAGRFANRIAKGHFTLDGKTYQLAINNNGNHLHGGLHGFDKAIWSIDSVQSGAVATVTFSYLSRDGEEGYPGNLRVTATYSLNSANELRLQYHATTDKPTIVNITNHSYFNLGSESSDRSVLDHLMQIPASSVTPVDSTLIPTGERRAVAGTPFDFRKPTRIGLHIRDGGEQQLQYGRGYDINFVLDGAPGTLHPAARVEDPVSGRVLEVLTTSPGLQFYSANYLDGTIMGKSGRFYRQSDAFCLEPQVFPDAPNQPGFPSARLDPGGSYDHTIVYRFSVAKVP
jgi:aldose 1-epimerase